MLGVLVGLLTVVGVYFALGKTKSYGSALEEYISSKNPSSIYEVERLAKKYDEKNKRNMI